MKSADRQKYVAWIGEYRWRIWAVFTFRRGIQVKTARRTFEKWIHDIEVNEARKISWLAFHERGSAGGLHFHVLIAGISTRIYRYVWHWNSLAGHCHVLKYDARHPGRNGEASPDRLRGIDYAMKSLRGDDYHFDGQLHDQHVLSRFRKETI